MTTTPQLRPLGGTLGTEALGVDLSKPLDEATSAWVVRAFAENPVLVFRDQDLGAVELAASAGTSAAYDPLIKCRHADHPVSGYQCREDGKVDW
jgi:taurine dioxygenase